MRSWWMKETSQVSHKLASSTSRQASNAKTEEGSATSSGGGHGAATAPGTATKQLVSLAARERPRFLRHSALDPALALPAKPSARPATPPSLPSFRFPLDSKESETQDSERAGGRAGARSACARAQGTRGLLHRSSASSSDLARCLPGTRSFLCAIVRLEMLTVAVTAALGAGSRGLPG